MPSYHAFTSFRPTLIGQDPPTPEVGDLTWALHNVWLSYRHTMDESILRGVVYPLLKRTINYYRHFLAVGAGIIDELRLDERRAIHRRRHRIGNACCKKRKRQSAQKPDRHDETQEDNSPSRVATYFVFAFLLAAILETMIATLGR